MLGHIFKNYVIYKIINRNRFSGELMFLNEATLLNNILTRYKKNKIYVSTDKKHAM